MNDAGFALEQAYATLFANLTYQGKPVKLYAGMAPDDAVAPYVILGPWLGRRDNTKDSFGQTGELTLDVVTRFTGNVRSRKPASKIASLITQALKPTTTAEVLSAPGWNIWMTTIGDTQNIEDNTSTGMLVRKLITVNHSLQQL